MAATDRVKQILSWYSSDNPGTLTNLYRLLNTGTLAGTGKLVILPVDQGFEHGPARSFAPNPDAYDPDYHFQLAIDAGCNAYAAPLGFLEAGAAQFAGEIPLILKLNNHDVLHDDKDPLPALTGSVEDALRLGCSAVGYTIYPGSAHATAMYTPFLVVILAAGAPPYLAVLSLAYFSNLDASLTHYGTTPAPIYFGSGYVKQRTWWRLGFIASLITIPIWIIFGFTWWKILKLW